MAVLHHVLSVMFMRASLHVEAPSSSKPITRNAYTVWDLTAADIRVEVRRRKLAKWSKAANDLVNNVSYLYGTMVFTSLTLVSGRVAIEKLAAFGVIAGAGRVAAVWVLEDVEGEE
jgi:hypothetical protein